jgi:hypothetical protein
MKPWRINDSIRGRLYIEDDDGLICDMQLEQAEAPLEMLRIRRNAEMICLVPNILNAINSLARKAGEEP